MNEIPVPGPHQLAVHEAVGARHLEHSWQEARQVAAAAEPVRTSAVPLAEAIGRVLKEPLRAAQDMPHYASAAMDGWAVNGTGPWIIVPAGERLSPHQGSAIATGGLMPPGAKAVLRSESALRTTDDDGLAVIAAGGTARPGEPKNGQHVRPAATEARVGEDLVPVGTLLSPAHVALAALAGVDSLAVEGKPLVRLLYTGAEVILQGRPEPGQVRDAFGPQLGHVVNLLGGIPAGQQRIGDSYEEWFKALEESGPQELPADVVITTGGTGRSATDHLRSVIRELGGNLLVDGIAMRPGHPTLLAELPDGRYILGLPGNPLAAMVALVTIGEPLLAALANRRQVPVLDVPSGTVIDASAGPTRVVPFRLVYGMASPAHRVGSGMLRGLAAADGLLVVPPHGVQLGEKVPALELPWRAGYLSTALAKTAAASQVRKPRVRREKAAGPVDWSALLEPGDLSP